MKKAKATTPPAPVLSTHEKAVADLRDLVAEFEQAEAASRSVSRELRRRILSMETKASTTRWSEAQGTYWAISSCLKVAKAQSDKWVNTLRNRRDEVQRWLDENASSPA